MASTEAAAYYPRVLRIGEILRRSRMASAGLTLGAVLVALAAFAPLVATADPTAMDFNAPFAGVVGASTGVLIVVIAVVYLPIIARTMRASTLAVRAEPFVEGARSRGASPLRLMARHVVPNAMDPVLIQASVLMGIAILIEAALSFIGLGTQPPP